MDEPIRRVLIVVTQQLGDVLLTTPLIAAVRERWPQARVGVIGIAGTLALLLGNPGIDERIEVSRGAGPAATLRLVRRLWRRYDLALVTQATDRAALFGWVAARRRSALVPRRGSGSGWWKSLLAQHRVEGDPDRHTVVQNLMLLEPWVDLSRLRGTVQAPARSALPPPIADRLRPGYLVVHAPSMWRYKQWPVEHFRTLISGLLARGHQVALTGSPAERDQGIVAQLRDLGPDTALIDASGTLGWGQVATLLAGAAAYIGPDTSVTHLAAALDTPLVALFGPTRPTCWGPWPQGHPARTPWALRGAEPHRVQRQGTIVLMQGPSRAGADCVPCGRAGCDDHRDSRSECLEGLRPEAVLAELQRLIGR